MHMLLLQKRKGGLVLCPAVVSDEDGKASRLRLIFHVNVMEFQQLRGDGKADFPFFSRLKPQLLKTPQLPHGSHHASRIIPDIELDSFRTPAFSGVLYGDGGGKRPFLSQRIAIEPHGGDGEAGVGQTVAKGV